jgi:hypothetical protein
MTFKLARLLLFAAFVVSAPFDKPGVSARIRGHAGS